MKKAIFFGFLFIIFVLGCSTTRIEFNPTSSAVVDVVEPDMLQDSNVTLDESSNETVDLPSSDEEDNETVDLVDDNESEDEPPVSTCGDLACEANKMCNNEGECACAEGKEWCEHQQLCIEEEACCSNFDCGRNQKCIFTLNAVQLCIDDGKKACKIVQEGKENVIMPTNTLYRILIKSVASDSVRLFIDDSDMITLDMDSSYTEDGFSAYVQRINIVKSQCVAT